MVVTCPPHIHAFQTQAHYRLRIAQQSSELVQSSNAVTPSGRSLPSAFGHCGLPLRLTALAPLTHDFAAQWLACWFPLPTLRRSLHGAQRMTRDRSVSP